jgi:hypothetical protein
MRKILFMSVITLVVLSLATVAGAQVEGFSGEVEEVFEKKINLVKKELAEDPLIIKTIRESNVKNKYISLKEIMRLNKRWIAAEGIDEFIKGFIANQCAQRLIEFQEAHDGYSEIFISDEKGLVVGATNKTSDYYQAGEDWWVKGYNEGRGKYFYGEIEYDENAMSEAIPIYVPIIDLDTKRAIGVMKVIIDIIAIKMEV